MADIFLSYSRFDREQALRIRITLERRGYGVFMDFDGIGPGEDWVKLIRDAVAEAKVCVALFSPHSLTSQSVLTEASVAQVQGKLIPVLIGEAVLPPPFNSIQYADLRHWRGDEADAGWQLLLRSIDRYLGRTATPPAPELIQPGAQIPITPGQKYPRVPPKLIFVAHASADKQRLRPHIEVLVDSGFKVWIDKPYECGLPASYLKRLARNRIEYGSDWKEAIRKAIRRADRVLAFWSSDAVKGRREQFHYEVYQGLVQNKLRQCRIDKLDFVEIGFPYTFHHIADLSEVTATQFHPAFRDLILDTAKGPVSNF